MAIYYFSTIGSDGRVYRQQVNANTVDAANRLAQQIAQQRGQRLFQTPQVNLQGTPGTVNYDQQGNPITATGMYTGGMATPEGFDTRAPARFPGGTLSNQPAPFYYPGMGFDNVPPTTIPPVMDNQQMMNVPPVMNNQIQDWERELLANDPYATQNTVQSVSPIGDYQGDPVNYGAATPGGESRPMRVEPDLGPGGEDDPFVTGRDPGYSFSGDERSFAQGFLTRQHLGSAKGRPIFLRPLHPKVFDEALRGDPAADPALVNMLDTETGGLIDDTRFEKGMFFEVREGNLQGSSVVRFIPYDEVDKIYGVDDFGKKKLAQDNFFQEQGPKSMWSNLKPDEVDPKDDVAPPEEDGIVDDGIVDDGTGDDTSLLPPYMQPGGEMPGAGEGVTEPKVVNVKPSYNAGTLAEFFGEIGIPVRDEIAGLDPMALLPGFPVELLSKDNLFVDVDQEKLQTFGMDQKTGLPITKKVIVTTRVVNPAIESAVQIYATRLKALTDFQGTANELITAQINATGGLGGVAGGLTPTQLEQLERDTRLIQATGGLVQREGELFEPLAQQRRQEELIRATGGLIGGGIEGIEDLSPTQVAEFRLAEARGGLSPEQRIAELQQQQQVQRYEAETQRQNLLAQLEAQRQQVASQRQLALFGQLGDIYGDPARLAAMTQFQPNLPAQMRNMAFQPSLPTVQPINIPIDPVMGANGQQEAVTTETTGVGEPGTVTGAGFAPLTGGRNDIPLGYDRYTGKETGADIAGMTDEQRQFLIGSGAALGKSPSAIEQEIMANTPLGLQVGQSRLRSAPIRR